MSLVLEQVIAMQQSEIDNWKARDLSSLQSWKREHEKREALVSAVFTYVNYPDAPHSLIAVTDAIRAWGYCLTCECSPCECDYD